MKTLAERLAYARSLKGDIWSQKHLAVVSGVSLSTIGMLESGKRGNTGKMPGTLPAIAKALDVNLDWLAYGTGDMRCNETSPSLLLPVGAMEEVLQKQVLQLAILLNLVPVADRLLAYTAASQALIGYLPGATPPVPPRTPVPQ